MAGEYFTGVGRSPVMASVASWNKARVATAFGSTSLPSTSRLMTARAWASTATSQLCCATSSSTALRIKPQRLMKRRRDRWA